MTRLLALAFVTAFTAAFPLRAADVTAKDLAGKRVLVLGDSITNGGVWVSMLSYYLMSQHPQADFDIVSIGLSSETVSGLSEDDHPFPRPCVHERLERALKAVKPQIVIACYGMNDGIYHPPSPERDKAYQDGILKLVTVAEAHGVTHTILMTPGQYDETAKKTSPTGPWSYKIPYSKYDDTLGGYAKWIMNLDRPRVSSVEIHSRMNDFAAAKQKTQPGFKLSGDGIHPGPLGHLIMAGAVAESLGLKVGADAEAELKRITGDPLYKLVHQQRSGRSKAWLGFVGYTRGKTVKTDSVNAAEAKYAEQKTQIDALRQK
jgi:lysophospholipase L1-like esterase